MDELYSFGPNYYSSPPPPPPHPMALPQVEHLPHTEYYTYFEPLSAVVSTTSTTSTPARRWTDPMPYYYAGSNSFAGSDCANSVAVEGGVQRAEALGGIAINDKIASHPLYPNLLQAYIDCQKVGAPPQVAQVLDEIRRENDLIGSRTMGSSCMGVDPELDAFMETYCNILLKYKSDLTKPFDEAITFLNSMEAELNTLANNNDAAAGISSDDEDLSVEEIDMQDSSDHQQAHEGHELKNKLFRRYSGYISTLKHEFSKKKTKGKLPKDSKQILTDWWNLHYKWPYPTEVDKLTLAQVTGLDQKQINNWFINQRKRHWKPSETMQFAVMESIYGPRTLSKDR